MKTVQYIGPSDRRIIGPEDFKRHGAEMSDTIDVLQGGTVEVTESAAKYLLDPEGNEKGEWVAVDNATKADELPIGDTDTEDKATDSPATPEKVQGSAKKR